MFLFWDNKKVLVTGGGGFIGANLVERLIEVGAIVRVVDNFERGGTENLASLKDAIDILHGDLREKAVCFDACKGIDTVFHLASKVGGIGYYIQNPADVILQNLLIDIQMLEAARKCRVTRYLYASSAYVYPIERMQDPYSTPLREEEAIPANPAVSYGWAKLLAENALKYSVEQDNLLKGVILRLANPYGPLQGIDLQRGSIIPVLIRRAIEYPHLKPFTIKGSGQETRSYCYIDDTLDAMVIAMEKLNESDLIGPLNVGSEDRIRIIDLAKEIIKLSGKDIEVVKEPAPPPLTSSQTLNCSMASEVLDGWKPGVTLNEGLKKMYCYIEEQLKRDGQSIG